MRSSIVETRWQRSKANRVERRKRKKFHYGGAWCLCKDRQRFLVPKVSRENLEHEKSGYDDNYLKKGKELMQSRL